MKNKNLNSAAVKVGGGLLTVMAVPAVVHACACGCGVFDVGTFSMLPNGQGGMAWFQYDYQDQNQNWASTSRASAAANSDKDIETHFGMLGAQYVFSNGWGGRIEIPYDFRYFKGTDNANQITSHSWSQLGDIRVEGVYTGFFPDSRAGIEFGLKLPTGSYTEDPFLVDRDTQIGTGSTDVLLGGFWRGNLNTDQTLGWFGQGLLDVPTLIQAGYRPGVEFDSAAGLDYTGIRLGKVLVAPIAQGLFSVRDHDSGEAASSQGSGYERILLSPALEIDVHPISIYMDAEFPVFQHFNGDQLAAPVLFKFSVSFMF